MRKCLIASIVVWIISAILLSLCILFLILFPAMYENGVQKKMVLTADSLSYDYWQTIQLPVYHELYFFNVTNPEEILLGAKPILQEIGPYVYREHLIKENISWNDNDTVTYEEKHVYIYQQNMTHLKEDDVITTINAPLITLAKTFESKSFIEKLLADLAFTYLIKSEKLFIERTVKQLAFDGYKDIIIALSSAFEKNPPYPGSTFAWFFKQNNTNDGVYTIRTGAKDITKFLWVDEWQHKKKLDFWSGDKCNEIKGPIPELFAPGLDVDVLETFISDVCRTLPLNYVTDKMVHNGAINSRHYAVQKTAFNNSGVNKCYCTGECYPSGVQDISSCHGNTPVAMSLPHFYLGDPKLLDPLIGLKPDKEKHEFYWDVEPITGMTSEFRARLQINIQLKNHFWLRELRNVSDVLFPVLWINKAGIMTDYLADNLLSHTVKPFKITNITCYTVLAIAIIVIIVTILLFLRNKRKDESEEKRRLLINEQLDDESDKLEDKNMIVHSENA